MRRVRSFEIKVHYLDITAFLCSFLFGPDLTVRNQMQMVPASLTSQLLHSVHPCFNLLPTRKFETRMNAVRELTVDHTRTFCLSVFLFQTAQRCRVEGDNFENVPRVETDIVLYG